MEDPLVMRQTARYCALSRCQRLRLIGAVTKEVGQRGKVVQFVLALLGCHANRS